MGDSYSAFHLRIKIPDSHSHCFLYITSLQQHGGVLMNS